MRRRAPERAQDGFREKAMTRHLKVAAAQLGPIHKADDRKAWSRA
jgi:hypothetical protein